MTVATCSCVSRQGVAPGYAAFNTVRTAGKPSGLRALQRFMCSKRAKQGQLFGHTGTAQSATMELPKARTQLHSMKGKQEKSRDPGLSCAQCCWLIRYSRQWFKHLLLGTHQARPTYNCIILPSAHPGQNHNRSHAFHPIHWSCDAIRKGHDRSDQAKTVTAAYTP